MGLQPRDDGSLEYSHFYFIRLDQIIRSMYTLIFSMHKKVNVNKYSRILS